MVMVVGANSVEVVNSCSENCFRLFIITSINEVLNSGSSGGRSGW